MKKTNFQKWANIADYKIADAHFSNVEEITETKNEDKKPNFDASRKPALKHFVLLKVPQIPAMPQTLI